MKPKLHLSTDQLTKTDICDKSALINLSWKDSLGLWIVFTQVQRSHFAEVLSSDSIVYCGLVFYKRSSLGGIEIMASQTQMPANFSHVTVSYNCKDLEPENLGYNAVWEFNTPLISAFHLTKYTCYIHFWEIHFWKYIFEKYTLKTRDLILFGGSLHFRFPLDQLPLKLVMF